ncbi:MAG TPA: carboxylating nicotinate-nucleotide diphosphorylase [Steroidobacteraceae bacterium]|nr:carboxylating nicotinate-nucleotide diphosphorylase [Steroidobacteraceae bacterium]
MTSPNPDSAIAVSDAALAAAAPARMPPAPADLPQQVERALREDIGGGDLTAALIPADRSGRARVISREAAVICGRPYVDACFAAIDPAVRLDWRIAEGEVVRPGQLLFEVGGPARALLTGERTALNFLQLLSATATAARTYAALVAGTACRVLDTRKTIPGLRTAQKYAVRVGGALNHRIGLFDAILIKENHIIAAGGIGAAVARARALDPRVPVEVEVETLGELRAAIAAGADCVLLDDFSLAHMREAVALNRAAARPLQLEVSGGVGPQSVRAIAETGVDFVSVGAITKHVRAVDLSMRFARAQPQES